MGLHRNPEFSPVPTGKLDQPDSSVVQSDSLNHEPFLLSHSLQRGRLMPQSMDVDFDSPGAAQKRGDALSQFYSNRCK